jgi:hypothetical protein
MTSGEQVVGVLALHVDDAIGGGTEEFHSVMAKIGKTLAVRSHDTSNFRTRAYACLQCSTKSKPCSKSTSTATTNWFLSDYGRASGRGHGFVPAAVHDRLSLGRRDHWICVVRVPPGPGVGKVVFVSPVCDTDHLEREASKRDSPVRPKNRVILKYCRGVENLKMFHDGSLGNLDDGKSQDGQIACLTNEIGHSVASWIFRESRTIKRVCRSSSASEILSAVEGYDATMWLLALWKELSG